MKAGLLAVAALSLGSPAWPQSPQALTPQATTTSALLGPALFVRDVQRSLAFYVTGLGMKVAIEMGPPQHRETILNFGGDPRSAGLILLSDQTATSPSPIEHGHGFDRVILRIANLGATEARLKAGGFATTPIRDVAQGYRMMTATDPDGYKLELVEAARPH